MKVKLLAILLAVNAVFVACAGSGGDRAKADGARSAAIVKSDNGLREIALPPIPDSLTDPVDRACYLADHYWDNLDFSDTSLSLDTAFMEQSFANFTTVLELLPDARLKSAVAKLIEASSVNHEANDFVLDIAERYLYDPQSPVYDERSYLPFVEYLLAADPADQLLAYRREMILKNSPGSSAPDFAFTTPDGSHGRLLDGDARYILLFFYEPDCEQCLATIDALASSSDLAEMVADGGLRVVLDYQGDDTDLWVAHAATLPAGWIAARDNGAIDRDDLYDVRLTPTIYLSRRDRASAATVVVKDASLPQLATALSLSR